jgi:predicted nucleotidyltransferase
MFMNLNIFSRPCLLCIRFLGRNYREGFYVREIAKLLHIGLGSASMCLKELKGEGLLVQERRGRLVIYRADVHNPLLREFKILFTLAELSPLTRDLSALSSRIILFGSCASGEDTDESDADLLIETEEARGTEAVLREHSRNMERKVSPVILTPREFRALREKDRPLQERILKGRVLHERSA